jgi:hypothetical protein
MFFELEDEDFEEEENDPEYKEIKRRARSNLFNNPIYFGELIQKKRKDMLAQIESGDKKMREKNDRLAKNPAMGEVLKDLEEEPPLAKRAGRRKKNEIGDAEEERKRKAEYQREYYRKQKEKKEAKELEKKAKKSSESSPAARGPPRK